MFWKWLLWQVELQGSMPLNLYNSYWYTAAMLPAIRQLIRVRKVHTR